MGVLDFDFFVTVPHHGPEIEVHSSTCNLSDSILKGPVEGTHTASAETAGPLTSGCAHASAGSGCSTSAHAYPLQGSLCAVGQVGGV